MGNQIKLAVAGFVKDSGLTLDEIIELAVEFRSYRLRNDTKGSDSKKGISPEYFKNIKANLKGPGFEIFEKQTLIQMVNDGANSSKLKRNRINYRNSIYFIKTVAKQLKNSNGMCEYDESTPEQDGQINDLINAVINNQHNNVTGVSSIGGVVWPAGRTFFYTMRSDNAVTDIEGLFFIIVGYFSVSEVWPLQVKEARAYFFNESANSIELNGQWFSIGNVHAHADESLMIKFSLTRKIRLEAANNLTKDGERIEGLLNLEITKKPKSGYLVDKNDTRAYRGKLYDFVADRIGMPFDVYAECFSTADHEFSDDFKRLAPSLAGRCKDLI